MLGKLKAALAASTQGEWISTGCVVCTPAPGGMRYLLQPFPRRGKRLVSGIKENQANLDLVAAMHSALPDLIEAIEALAEVTSCLENWMEIASEEDERDYDYEARDRAKAVLEKLGVKV
jgi:hypothetical protein